MSEIPTPAVRTSWPTPRPERPAGSKPAAERPELTPSEVRLLFAVWSDALSDREAGVIRMRYGMTTGKRVTYANIAKVYGVSTERIRQVEKAVIAKMLSGPPPPPKEPPAPEPDPPSDYWAFAEDEQL